MTGAARRASRYSPDAGRIYLSVEEAARLLRVSDHTLRLWTLSGDLVAYWVVPAGSDGKPRKVYLLADVLRYRDGVGG